MHGRIRVVITSFAAQHRDVPIGDEFKLDFRKNYSTGFDEARVYKTSNTSLDSFNCSLGSHFRNTIRSETDPTRFTDDTAIIIYCVVSDHSSQVESIGNRSQEPVSVSMGERALSPARERVVWVRIPAFLSHLRNACLVRMRFSVESTERKSARKSDGRTVVVSQQSSY